MTASSLAYQTRASSLSGSRSGKTQRLALMYSTVIAAGLSYGFTLCNLNDFVLEAYSAVTPAFLEVGIPSFEPGQEDPTQKSILSSLTSAVLVGSIVGSMSVARVVERRGNRWACLAFGLIGMLTNMIQAIPINWIYLLIARVLVGVSTSALTTVAPAFISERAESSRRGAMIISFQMATCFGQVLAYILTVILDVASVPELWFLLSAAPWACNLVISLSVVYLGNAEALGEISEAPVQTSQNYVVEDQESDHLPAETKPAHRHDKSSVKSSERHLSNEGETVGLIHRENGIRQEEDEDTVSSSRSTHESSPTRPDHAQGSRDEERDTKYVTWHDLFCSKTYRRSLLVAMLMPFQQQAEGINTCMMYATRVFSSLNIPYSDTVGAVFVSLWNFISTCVSAPLVDRLGRRKLLFIGNGFALAGLVLFAVSYAFIVPTYSSESIQIACIAVSALLFIFGFEIGAGPLMYVVCGEALPREVKAKLGSLSFSILWGTNILVVFTFPFFEGIEWAAFAIYACFTVLTSVALYFILPETKGKTLAEIETVMKK